MAQEAILIKEKGVVTLNKSFDFMCSQLRNGRYRLIIERYTEPRTLSQNALMWLWFTCIEQKQERTNRTYTIITATYIYEGQPLSKEKKRS